jgi:hypothetical protein
LFSAGCDTVCTEEDAQYMVAVSNRAAPKFKHRIADYFKQRGIYADGNEGGMVRGASSVEGFGTPSVCFRCEGALRDGCILLGAPQINMQKKKGFKPPPGSNGKVRVVGPLWGRCIDSM